MNPHALLPQEVQSLLYHIADYNRRQIMCSMLLNHVGDRQNQNLATLTDLMELQMALGRVTESSGNLSDCLESIKNRMEEEEKKENSP